jgi:hypothetical protein
MISKVRIAARVSHGVVIIRLGSQCVVARLGAALAGRVGLGLAIALGGVGLIALANAASPIKTTALGLPVAGFNGKAGDHHLMVAGIAKANQLSAISGNQEVVGAVGECGEGHVSRVGVEALASCPLIIHCRQCADKGGR